MVSNSNIWRLLYINERNKYFKISQENIAKTQAKTFLLSHLVSKFIIREISLMLNILL